MLKEVEKTRVALSADTEASLVIDDIADEEGIDEEMSTDGLNEIIAPFAE